MSLAPLDPLVATLAPEARCAPRRVLGEKKGLPPRWSRPR